MDNDQAHRQLMEFVLAHPRLLVLTGAGISASAGVPTYRDSNGQWQRKPPVQHADFLADLLTRQRFWARNMVGWRFMRDARPSVSHYALAELESLGYVQALVTQNVDGLHQRAGSREVIDLHGRIDRVSCQTCGEETHREDIQQWLEQHNPGFAEQAGSIGPDGDANVDDLDFSRLQVRDCERCGGILKPNAVFFGGSVPSEVVARAASAMQQSDALLVVGSSLMIYSGFRFCRWAEDQQKPIVAINQGTTRADDMLSLKVDMPCDAVLPPLVAALKGGS
ncbi:NAD-dependent protein deacetylase [Porticoccus litoralis]|uniref:protein acetyllysine N-acetyltransferase n=1 Tax=Porticoccus litoralis TaxID=434086 RepID=A0AAW8B1B3_9GAMM|nr:NAD-dependent protein deacetylase [Porticoccus litoralis]MDP1520277.1 NAD-dependent protein deacetylase [Porticoccus litoralis]